MDRDRGDCRPDAHGQFAAPPSAARGLSPRPKRAAKKTRRSSPNSRKGSSAAQTPNSSNSLRLVEVAERVPEGETIAVFPSLHPLQWPTFTKHARVWDHTPRRLALYGTPDAAEASWVMIFRRKADLPEHLRNDPPDTRRVCEVRRAGVLLAALYHRDTPQNPSAELRKPRPDTYTEANP